jgi:hypothetical protein
MYHLGTMHETGQGVTRDLNEALRLYQMAVAGGSNEAKARLAQMRGRNTARGPVSVVVPGNKPWTDTGVLLNPGDRVTVSATGTISVTPEGRIPPKSPAGFQSNCTAAAALYGRSPEPYPAPQFHCWALLGRIGPNGAIFEIGATRTVQTKTSGRLYLGVNDNTPQDNSGSWTATVSTR